MGKPEDTPFKTPHHRAYFLAVSVVVASGLAVASISVLFFGNGLKEDEATLFRLAAVWIPVYFGTRWLVARKIGGLTMSPDWQESLTRVVPFGLIVAAITMTDTASLWASLCQLVGGWIIISAILIASEWALDTAWARFKAYRANH